MRLRRKFKTAKEDSSKPGGASGAQFTTAKTNQFKPGFELDALAVGNFAYGT